MDNNMIPAELLSMLSR